MVFCNGFAEIRMSREESRSEEACSNGAGEREDEPNHADLAGARHHRRILGGHEANQNMRLTEVTKAPSQQRNHTDEGLALKHVEVRRINRSNLLDGCRESA
ncbi:unknown [Parasutterella excrementihominis CAG:233]|nr:unknown [Parasutterella excrementihominis CAG:233]